MKKFYALLPFLGLFLIACEDDPLLAPTEPTEEKGSYAKLSLPGSEERPDYQNNPEVY